MAQNLFQLVLQFRPWNSGPEKLVALEQELSEVLGAAVDVDGHDWGSNEANIFMYCAEPSVVLPKCVSLVSAAGMLPLLSAAHRPIDGEQYTRLWPAADGRPFEVK